MQQLVQGAPSMEAMNIQLLRPEELPFGDLVEYTTLGQVVANYEQDPFGTKTFDYLQNAFGIQDLDAFFRDAGLEEYVKQKRERGAFVGAVKSHTFQQTPYNLFSDIAAGAYLNQQMGIPAAILAFGYEDDIFHSSPEKMEAFGTQKFFVGYSQKKDEAPRPQFTSIHVKATAVRERDGSVRNISVIDEASGYPLKDIFVDVTAPQDPRNAHAVMCDAHGERKEYIEAALGMSRDEILSNPHSLNENPGMITIAQLHKTLFEKTVERMRNEGVLPSEAEMPIIYAEISQLSQALLKHAKPPQETLDVLAFDGKPQRILRDLLCTHPQEAEAIYEYLNGSGKSADAESATRTHHEAMSEEDDRTIEALPDDVAEAIMQFKMAQLQLSFDERTGLLRRGEMADPAAYYPIFSALLDSDLTSLNEESQYFTAKIHRSQELMRRHDLSISTIRIPHHEIEDFDTTRIHPTGVYYDIKTPENDAFMQKVKPRLDEYGPKPSSETMQRMKYEFLAEFYAALPQNGEMARDYRRVSEAIVTDPILSWWASMIATIPVQVGAV